MRRRVEVLAAARRDLIRLEAFLVERNPGAAVRAAAVISDAVLSLGQLAERGRRDPESELREIVVQFGRNGYVIQCLVEPERVLVARIFHAREAR
ncbi:MAG: type II toxin-antitoxin system RelE/ParE family toxin [Phenylobacterium sp.]|uniref:type II toxin-antitoxin system RelE/ParE family toxin n=1 Tax=Phenylobacterium sp. TaxID=1871053 RepID=UPI0039195C2F